MNDYTNYAMVKDGAASRTPLPPELWVLSPSDLLSLDWLAAQYQLPVGAQWWPIEDQSAPLGQYQSYGSETLTIDPGRTVVVALRPVTDWTAEQILAYKASIPRRISRLAFRNRFTAPEKIAFEMAQVDDPSGNLAVRQVAAALRVLEKDLNVGTYVDLNAVATQAGIWQLEALGIIAAGRADEIIWGDIAPVEVP
jgi:hypothetical protein